MTDARTTDLVSRLRQTAAAGYAGWDTARDAADEIERLNQTASAFYKRVSARVPGLLAQIEDVAKPLRIALGMEDSSDDAMPTVDPYTPRARKGPQGHPTAFEQAKQLEHSSDDVPAPPPPPPPPPMRYIKEGAHVAGCEHGVKIGTHCPKCDALDSKHSTRPVANKGE